MKVYIETLGCVKNAEDSERAAGILEQAGHEILGTPLNAECIMVNTCGFIGDAKKESIEKIFEMAEIKEEKLLLISGCLSERYQEELYKEMPEVDLFLGVNDYENLPKILDKFMDSKSADFKKRKKYFGSPDLTFNEKKSRKRMGPSYTANLKIAEGCDNSCAYCVIPSIRGPYRSRKIEDILSEAKELVDDGCKELVLIAQDVTGYGKDIYGELTLPKLIKQLCGVKDLRWLRLMYCYEDRITDELIKVMAEEEKVCNYIDIPIQHSEDKILSSMNRRSTNFSIKNTIMGLRKAMPDINIRTTLITGFPGEDKDDFIALADFVEEMKFERLGVFAYSKEEGTPAAQMKGQIRADTKEKRKNTLMTMQLDISLNSNKAKIGRVLEVLTEEEEIDLQGGGQGVGYTYVGRSRYDAPEIDNSVIFTSDKAVNLGDIVNVKIIDAFDYDLVGEVV